MSSQGSKAGRLAAWVALLAMAAVVVALGILLVRNFVTLLIVLAAFAAAAAAGWIALTRRGAIRPVAGVVAIAALVGAAVAMIARGAVDELVIFVVAGLAFFAAARRAVRESRQAAATTPSASRAGSTR